MPPNLHPRSAHTTTLFGTTLAVSFLVVGLPHLLPCPVPPRQHLDASAVEEVVDGNGRRVYRRVYKRPTGQNPRNEHAGGETMVTGFEMDVRKERECPVPKPGGILGRWLGFEDTERRFKEHRGPVVRVEGSKQEPSSEQTDGS